MDSRNSRIYAVVSGESIVRLKAKDKVNTYFDLILDYVSHLLVGHYVRTGNLISRPC